jgi:hypothetical protein
MTPTKHPHDAHAYDDGVHDAADHDRLHNDDVAHEHSDVNVRTVLVAALVLATVVAVSAVAMWGLFRLLEHQAAANDPQLSPLAIPAGQQPPEPRLQTNEPAALRKFHETEDRTLENYGWIDQKNGVAHMPIGEAKKLLLERGLPTRSGTADPAEGTHAPAYGEANGGRAIGRPPVSR